MRILQLRRLTTAQRTAVTPEDGEPIWDTDLSALYIGDGSTAGGVLVIDESLYFLTDGSRTITGDVLLAKTSLPIMRLRNTTGADTNHSRSSAVLWSGKTLAGTNHDLMLIGSRHDGTAADQKCETLIQLNNGTLLSDFAYWYGTDKLADFQGEVRHTHGRKIHAGRTSGGPQAFPASTATKIEWVTASRADTGFTLGGTNGDRITFGFAGRIRVSYHAYWQLDSPPAFVEAVTIANLNGSAINRSRSLSSHLSINGTGLAGYGGVNVEFETVVASSDYLEVETTVSAGGALDLPDNYNGIIVERIQGNS